MITHVPKTIQDSTFDAILLKLETLRFQATTASEAFGLKKAITIIEQTKRDVIKNSHTQ